MLPEEQITKFEELYKKLKTYIKSETDLDKIKDAYTYAKDIHFGKKRLNGEDFILHPLNVAYILSNVFSDTKTIITALLHEVISVGEVDEAEIEKIFGKDILFLVNGISKINKLSMSAESEAVVNYYKKILVGLSSDARIILVKLADRLYNMRTLYILPVSKQKEKAKETLEILVSIAHRLGIQKIKSELEDLSLKYYKPEIYNDILEKINDSREELDSLVNEIMTDISKILKENNIAHEMKGRTKSIYSIYTKLSKGRDFKDIYDILALRFILNTEQECYLALGLIHSKYMSIPKRFKDYISRPKSNMYQSLHTSVFGPQGKVFEIQIRTKEMDQIAEYGYASHWSYKEKGKISKDIIDQKLGLFRDILTLNDDISNDEFIKSVKSDLLSDEVIYTYTPKGDVIELPKGATPIDFAYKVHSNIGDTMCGALVNNTIVPLNYVLNDGDIVKINTNKNSKGPSKEWINIAYTANAKGKIRNFYSKINKDDATIKGKDILNRVLLKRKININTFYNDDNIKVILEDLNINNIDDLFYQIVKNKNIIKNIINIYIKKNNIVDTNVLKKLIGNSVNTNENNDILVDNVKYIKTNLANCCMPIKGDDIVGYVTKGNGVTIHRKECYNIVGIRDRKIDVKWSNEKEKKYKTKIKIFTNTDKDLIMEILTKTSACNVNIISFKKNLHNNSMDYELLINVLDIDALTKLMISLKQINSILSVERMCE
ncbi:MAG TPA: RelA/SpoT family protein [Bacilli bacterium]|nr:RelA/SpoT family protein [Bacilli bacterium]